MTERMRLPACVHRSRAVHSSSYCCSMEFKGRRLWHGLIASSCLCAPPVGSLTGGLRAAQDCIARVGNEFFCTASEDMSLLRLWLNGYHNLHLPPLICREGEVASD